MSATPIRRTAWWNVRGRRECCEAETPDGRWQFVRIEDDSTPWLIFPHGAASATIRRSTLDACARWVAAR